MRTYNQIQMVRNALNMALANGEIGTGDFFSPEDGLPVCAVGHALNALGHLPEQDDDGLYRYDDTDNVGYWLGVEDYVIDCTVEQNDDGHVELAIDTLLANMEGWTGFCRAKGSPS